MKIYLVNVLQKEAIEPDSFKVYRLAKAPEINEEDFKSQRALKPKKVFKGVNECIARFYHYILKQEELQTEKEFE